MDLLPPESPSCVAAQARAVVRRLAQVVEGADRGTPTELARMLAALKLLSDDVALLLPLLQKQLEEGVLEDRVVRVGRGAAETWDAVSAVGSALSHARSAGLLAVRELESAQVVLRGLAVR